MMLQHYLWGVVLSSREVKGKELSISECKTGRAQNYTVELHFKCASLCHVFWVIACAPFHTGEGSMYTWCCNYSKLSIFLSYTAALPASKFPKTFGESGGKMRGEGWREGRGEEGEKVQELSKSLKLIPKCWCEDFLRCLLRNRSQSSLCPARGPSWTSKLKWVTSLCLRAPSKPSFPTWQALDTRAETGADRKSVV